MFYKLDWIFEEVHRYIDTYKIGGAMDVVCVDFSKVFDNVPKIYANPKC